MINRKNIQSVEEVYLYTVDGYRMDIHMETKTYYRMEVDGGYVRFSYRPERCVYKAEVFVAGFCGSAEAPSKHEEGYPNASALEEALKKAYASLARQMAEKAIAQ